MKPISNMAFYCCGARMQDAAAAIPICGDGYAKLFMNDYGQRIYDQFQKETFSKVSMTVRHRIIDELLRQMLLAHENLCIVTIGAGFDSRPYRLTGGAWFELDEPALITYKNECLPVGECANPLQRIPINFCTDSLKDKLSLIAHSGPVVFILEGIFIYLTESETRELTQTLNTLFPQHRLVCDLVNRDMVEKYGRQLRDIARQMNAPFKAIDRPESVFSKNGYRAEKRISLVEVCVDLGLYNFPRYFLNYFLKNEVDGNAVYVWQDQKTPARTPAGRAQAAQASLSLMGG